MLPPSFLPCWTSGLRCRTRRLDGPICRNASPACQRDYLITRRPPTERQADRAGDDTADCGRGRPIEQRRPDPLSAARRISGPDYGQPRRTLGSLPHQMNRLSSTNLVRNSHIANRRWPTNPPVDHSRCQSAIVGERVGVTPETAGIRRIGPRAPPRYGDSMTHARQRPHHGPRPRCNHPGRRRARAGLGAAGRM